MWFNAGRIMMCLRSLITGSFSEGIMCKPENRRDFHQIRFKNFEPLPFSLNHPVRRRRHSRSSPHHIHLMCKYEISIGIHDIQTSIYTVGHNCTCACGLHLISLVTVLVSFLCVIDVGIH